MAAPLDQVPVIIVLPRHEKGCFAIRHLRTTHRSISQSRHLRGYSKEVIVNLLQPFLDTCLDEASKSAFDRWVQCGAWQQPGDCDRTVEAIGCALLKSPPIPLDSYVAMQSQHFWVLWNVWGSPAPRDTFPPMMFFRGCRCSEVLPTSRYHGSLLQSRKCCLFNPEAAGP